jgi:hypothetical protein
MNRSARALAIILCVALVSGCATVTASTDGSRRTSSPTWSHRMWFLFGGFISDKHVDVQEVCGGGTAVQVQSQHTFVDGLISLATFGILSPRTAKVWCR